MDEEHRGTLQHARVKDEQQRPMKDQEASAVEVSGENDKPGYEEYSCENHESGNKDESQENVAQSHLGEYCMSPTSRAHIDVARIPPRSHA